MTKVNEGGSVLSFVAIGAILVLLLVGGTYFVRQKMSVNAQTAGQTPDTSQPQPSDSTDTSKKPAKEEPAKTPEASKPDPSSSQPQNTTPPPAALPKTGPAQTLSVLIGLALLTATFTAYIRSRRDYASL